MLLSSLVRLWLIFSRIAGGMLERIGQSLYPTNGYLDARQFLLQLFDCFMEAIDIHTKPIGLKNHTPLGG